MKWIGQHIYDLVSRFRNDVYLENLTTTTGTDALVVDSNGKISKNTSIGGDITSLGTITQDTITFTSANADDPLFVLENTTDDDQASRLQFKKLRADNGVATGQNLGEIHFDGQDDGRNAQTYSYIISEIDVSVDGEESGKLNLGVASHNGTNQPGLILTGGSVAGEVDATIGRGAASVTTVAGTLTVGSTSFVNNSGVIQVATQGTIDHDSLANFVANEHIDWTGSSAGTIHSSNIPTLNQNTTGTAATVTTAAQPNITSLGTLTELRVDDIILNTKSILITGDTDDTFNKTTGAAGATTLTTTDNAGAAGHFEVAADGDITLDAAGTIKLEGPTRSTGQIHMTHHNFSDDIDTTKHYVGLARGDSENTATTQIHTPLVFPTAAKLLKIYLRANQNLSAKEITFTLETQAAGVTFGTGPTIIGTKALSGPTNSSIVTYDMTADHIDSGDNIVDAGDAAYLGIESSASTNTTKFYITCIWEIDFSSI